MCIDMYDKDGSIPHIERREEKSGKGKSLGEYVSSDAGRKALRCRECMKLTEDNVKRVKVD